MVRSQPLGGTLAIFPPQDLFGLSSEHRANLPGSPCGSNRRCLDNELSPQLVQWFAHLTTGAGRCHFSHSIRE
jgi:hypothetical protein